MTSTWRTRASSRGRPFPGDTDADDEYHADPMQCPACRRDVPEASLFCEACGTRVGGSRAPTLTAADGAPPASDALDGAQFIPGTMLSGRYRIVGLAALTGGKATPGARTDKIPPASRGKLCRGVASR
jgi:hypothetical protein